MFFAFLYNYIDIKIPSNNAKITICTFYPKYVPCVASEQNQYTLIIVTSTFIISVIRKLSSPIQFIIKVDVTITTIQSTHT